MSLFSIFKSKKPDGDSSKDSLFEGEASDQGFNYEHTFFFFVVTPKEEEAIIKIFSDFDSSFAVDPDSVVVFAGSKFQRSDIFDGEAAKEDIFEIAQQLTNTISEESLPDQLKDDQKQRILKITKSLFNKDEDIQGSGRCLDMLDELDLYIKDKEGDEFVLPFLISFKSNKEFLDQDDYSDEDIKYTLINRGNFLPTLNQELGRFDFLYLDDKDRFWEMSDVGKDASIENVSNDEINYAGS